MSPFERRSPLAEAWASNRGQIVAVALVTVCIIAGWRMLPHGDEETVVQTPFPKTPRETEPAPSAPAAGPSSLDMRPSWGGLPLANPDPPAPEQKPEPPPQDPAPPPVPQPPQPQAPEPPAKPQLPKPGLAPAPSRSGSNSKPTMSPVASFEKRERVEKGLEKEDAKPSDLGTASAVEAQKQRSLHAILQAGAAGSLERYGLTKEHMFSIQQAGVDLAPYVQPDGTLKISEEDARKLAAKLGISLGAVDIPPPPSTARE